MRSEFVSAVILLATGIVITVARLVLAFGAEGAPGAGPSGTYSGPLIFFLGLVALGRAQQKKGLDRR